MPSATLPCPAKTDLAPRRPAKLGPPPETPKVASAHLPLVRTIAERYVPEGRTHGIWDHSHRCRADLIQAGCCGLLRAVTGWNRGEGAGRRWTSYASNWIRHYIQAEVYGYVRGVRVPRHYAEERRAYGRAAKAVAKRTGRTPETEEVLDEMGTAGQARDRIRRAGAFLARPACEDGPSFVPESPREEPGYAAVDARDEFEARVKLDALSPWERKVITTLYGLGDGPALNQSEAAKALGVSRGRVQQIHERALVKLRQAAAEANP